MRKGKGRNKRKEEQEIDEEIQSMRFAEDNRKKGNAESVLNFQFAPGIRLKNDKQKELITKIHDNSIIFVAGPAGTGKAQSMDSLILTPSGFKKMENIKIGDYVISSDGNSTEVIGVFPQGKKEMFKVTFSDGTSTECCDEHLWLTQTYNDRNHRKRKKDRSRVSEERVGTIKQLKEIQKTIFTKRGDKNHSIPIVNPINFDKQYLPIEPYLLGVLLGDGGLTTSIKLSSIDKQIVFECESRLPNGISINKLKGENCDFSITKKSRQKNGSNILINKLKEIGIFGKKSENKFIPDSYKFNTVFNRIELLRGLMDTDGYVSKDGHSVEFYTSSKKLSEDVIFLVQSLGGIVYVNKKQKYFTYKGIKKLGQTSYMLTICMNPDINPFKLTRKVNRVIPKTRYKPKRYITNIESIGNKEAQCIMVDNTNGLYITNDCIVTHNTFIALKGALEIIKNHGATNIDKILITKPIVEAGGESIGFLPGDINEKTEPYMHSFEANFKKLIGPASSESLYKYGVVKSVPLTYMRGNTFENCVVILDEAQNTTVTGLKLFLSRIGENAKLIILGDIDQTDLSLKKDEKSGMQDAFERFQNLKKVAFMEFNEDDIVRSNILIELMKRYKK